MTTAAPVTTRARPDFLPSPADVLGRAGGENFVVASRLLPAQVRSDLLAFYGYARFVDQLGDAYQGDRLAALDWAEAELDAALVDQDRADLHPLVVAAAAAVTRLGADPAPLRHLIEANRLDQSTATYATWDDLVGYCRLSADPVGRLVLATFGATTPQHEAWSDSICTGLQVVEHLQDVAEDVLAGRVYLPADDMARFSVTADDLVDLAVSRAPAPATVRGLIGFEAWRALALLDRGAPLVGSLRGRAGVAVAGFLAGGRAALDALAACGYDPFPRTPKPNKARAIRHAGALLAENLRVNLHRGGR